MEWLCITRVVMAGSMTHRIVLGVAAACALVVATDVVLPSSATVPASAVTRAASADATADCVPQGLCYGLSDDNHADVKQAYEVDGVRRFRKIIPFNVALPMKPGCDQPGVWARRVADMDNWHAALKGLTDVEILVSFGRDPCMKPREIKAITSQQYKDAIVAFDAKYKSDSGQPFANIFTAWNEPNHVDQGYRHVRRNGKIKEGSRRDLNGARVAGVRFRDLQDYCNSRAPRCEVLAGDFAEPQRPRSRNWRAWVANYRKGAQLTDNAQKWAIHPYTSVQRYKKQQRRAHLRKFIGSIEPFGGELWFTEVGAFHHSRDPQDDHVMIPANTKRQYERLRFLLRQLASKAFDPRIARLYYYQWTDNNEPHGTGLARIPSELDDLQADIAPGTPFCLWHHRTKPAAERGKACNP
jgi:hypothetical protein